MRQSTIVQVKTKKWGSPGNGGVQEMEESQKWGSPANGGVPGLGESSQNWGSSRNLKWGNYQ